MSLTNERLQHFIDRTSIIPSNQEVSDAFSELLELRKLRDSAVAEFDETAAMRKGWEYIELEKDQVCATVYGVENRECVTFEQGARWQYSQDQLAYAALMAEAEKLVHALVQVVSEVGTSTLANKISVKALTAWKEKYSKGDV